MKANTKKQKVKIPHMVFVDGNSNPRYVHDSEAEAVKEAKRLAEQHPHRQVRVLKIVKQFVGCVQVELKPYEFPEEIPF